VGKPDNNQDSVLAVTLTVGKLREIIRQEMQQASNGNGHQQPQLAYTTKEAAKIIGVPDTWLAKAARQGDVSCVRMGHYVNFTPDDLKSFIKKIKARKT